MNFADPRQLSWFFLLVALAAFAVLSFRRKIADIAKLVELPLLSKMFSFEGWKRSSRRSFIFNFLGFLFLILALAGPQVGQKFQEVKTKGSNVFILFDVSDSMLAEDFKPSRLEKSKRMLSGMLEKLHGNKVGIIAFAGEAYVYCPLTFDLSTVRQFLKSVEPGMIPQPGTAIGSAVRLAISKLPPEQAAALVLLTDGEDHRSEPLKAAEEAKGAGAKIYAIGIGNPEGEPIPVRDGTGNITGYKKKKNGDVVLSKMDEQTLAQMAQATGGAYFRASESEGEIDVLTQQLEQMGQNPMTQKLNAYENRYQWFALPALLFLILGESWMVLAGPGKASRLAAALVLLCLSPRALEAETFRGKMNDGADNYKRKQYYEALKDFEAAEQMKPSDSRAQYNKGTAHYRLKDWDKAKEEFQKGAGAKSSQLRAKSFYNLGNAQFQAQDYANAARSYRESLRLNPDDPDARFNLQLALQLLAHPPQQQKQQQQNQDQKQQRGGPGKKDDQEKEREENAKRILKGAAGEDNNKPIFKPNSKDKKKTDDEEDW